MTSLTKQQQELVAQNLPVVHWVICDYIHVNPTICGLEYSDLFQEGCVWLCKAATTYKDDGRAQFTTYAKTVVKNGLLSYCRTICNRGKMFSRLIIGEHGELAADGEALEPQSDGCMDLALSRQTAQRPPLSGKLALNLLKTTAFLQ